MFYLLYKARLSTTILKVSTIIWIYKFNSGFSLPHGLLECLDVGVTWCDCKKWVGITFNGFLFFFLQKILTISAIFSNWPK